MYHKDIASIWNKYPAELHKWLLQLTEEFDLTFPLPKDNINIVPCLLPQEEPQEVGRVTKTFHALKCSHIPMYHLFTLLYEQQSDNTLFTTSCKQQSDKTCITTLCEQHTDDTHMAIMWATVWQYNTTSCEQHFDNTLITISCENRFDNTLINT